MISLFQRSFYFDSNCADKVSNEVQGYSTTREITTSLGNSFPTRNICYQQENPAQSNLHNRLITVLSLQTYLSSALKIKKIWQSFIDLVKDSQSLQGIVQFFTKKFKGISVSAIQLNAYFSFFKRKEIHHNTVIINHNEAIKEDIKGMFQENAQVVNSLKDTLLAQNKTIIGLVTQRNEELTLENEKLVQELETKSRIIDEQNQEIERIKHIQNKSPISHKKVVITFNTTMELSRRRTKSEPSKLIARHN